MDGEENKDSQNSDATANSGVEQSVVAGDGTKTGEGAANGAPADAASKGAADTGDAGTKIVEKKDEKPKSALDAVQRVLDKGRQTAATDAAGEKKVEGQQQQQQAADGDKDGHKDGEKDWIDQKTYAGLPAAVKQRIGTLSTRARNAEGRISELEPRAKTYDDLAAYCKKSGLSSDDFTFGLELVRLVRQDPAAAYERLQPLLKELQAYVGEILPNDLQKEVDDGKITEARAKELASARRERQRLTVESQERTESDRQAEQLQRAKDHQGRIQGAIETWEKSFKATDPDYAKLAEMVWERMVTLMQGQESKLTPELAVKLANQAKDDVKKRLVGVLPKKEEKRPLMQGGSSSNVSGKPGSALEAARMAVRATAA